MKNTRPSPKPGPSPMNTPGPSPMNTPGPSPMKSPGSIPTRTTGHRAAGHRTSSGRRTAPATEVRPEQAPPPAGDRRRRRLADQGRAYAFLLGGLICFALFSWYPAIRAVVIAFQKYTPGADPEWVGTANFTRVVRDPEFAAAWRNTLTFTLLALLIGFAIPFVLALVLNDSGTPGPSSGSSSTCR